MSSPPLVRADATIRPARPDDVDALVQMVHDLALFERSPDSVEIDRAQLHDALFGDAPTVFAHVAEVDGRVVGTAIWFLTFSTWTGRRGIYLEDLFVDPEARSLGIGRALLAELAAMADRSGYRRVEWSVLDWNEGARRLYRSIGAVPMDGWTVYRLDGSELDGLATEAKPAAEPPPGPAQMVKARLATSRSPSSRSPE